MLKIIREEAERIPLNLEGMNTVCRKQSAVQGMGVFVVKPFEEGETIFTVSGKFIEEAYRPGDSLMKQSWVGATKNRWIIPDKDNPVVHLNHHCTPNCYINDEFAVVAMRNLLQDEELFLDYSTTEIDPFWELECTCGGPQCRRKIKAFQYLPKSLQFKYLKYIPMRLFNFIPKSS